MLQFTCQPELGPHFITKLQIQDQIYDFNAPFDFHIIIQISMKKQGYSGDLNYHSVPDLNSQAQEPEKAKNRAKYEESICWLFETVQDKFKNYQIQVIRSLLFYVRHICHRTSGEKKQATASLPQLLNTVVCVFVHKIYNQYPIEDLHFCLNSGLPEAQIKSFPQLKDLVNPYQILQGFKKVLNGQYIEAAAELMTLAMTKIQFSAIDSQALAIGSVQAIKQMKSVSADLVGSENPETSAQIQKSKNLYKVLLVQVEQMCQSK